MLIKKILCELTKKKQKNIKKNLFFFILLIKLQKTSKKHQKNIKKTYFFIFVNKKIKKTCK